MKTSDVTILMFPETQNLTAQHWMKRWGERLSTATLVEAQPDDISQWFDLIEFHVFNAQKPIMAIAHGLGVAAFARSAEKFKGKVIGGFLVAPPDPELWDARLKNIEDDPLPFPSQIVAPRNNPHCRYEQAAELALIWGAHLVDAGASGTLNEHSGHGPWPDGLLRFGVFLQRLSA